MPTYNCGEYIIDSIESVLAQTLTDWELLIIDDCSTDNTKDIVKPYTEKDDRIKYHCLKENGGPQKARTYGIQKASGKYVAFLDSDDIWKDSKLEIQTNFMERNHWLMSATGYSLMNESGDALHIAMLPPKMMDYRKCVRLSNPIGNLTVMYNQEELGKFEVPDIKKRNDFALWLQILKKADYCYGLDTILATYRIGRSGSVSSNKLKQAKYHWQLYHQIEHHSILQSTYEVLCWAFVKGTGIGLRKTGC